jgi:magnesium chelatase family protein
MSNGKRATHPCQCGYFGDDLHQYTCTPPLIQRYLARVSGPLLDRIDMHIQVPSVKYKELAQDEKAEESNVVRERILAARAIQRKRLESFRIYCNAQMTPRTLRRFCKLDTESEKQMENAITRLGLSARAYDRILRVSRTMADLELSEKIQARHVSEAIQYRTLDRTYWQ